jgi:hypothetical protein
VDIILDFGADVTIENYKKVSPLLVRLIHPPRTPALP